MSDLICKVFPFLQLDCFLLEYTNVNAALC